MRLFILGLLSWALAACAAPGGPISPGDGGKRSRPAGPDVPPSTAAFRGALAAMGLRADAEGLVIDKSYVRGDWQGERRAYWTLLASDGSKRLRLEATKNIDRDAAEGRMKERFSAVEMLYFGDAAYPGLVTKRFEVPDGLKPEDLPDGPGGYRTLILHATGRMAYGAGAEDLVAYRSLMSYRYCRKERLLVQIEVFHPKAAFDRERSLSELAAVTCR